MIDLNIFNIRPCDMSDILSETTRFLFHISLVHIATYLIDGREELFGMNMIRTLFVTAVAVILYHLLIKKIIEPKLKNIRQVCDIDDKVKEIPQKKDNKDKNVRKSDKNRKSRSV